MKISKSRTTQETAALIRENYSAIWPPILDSWTRYLIDCRKAFDGDLDAMLILAAIGNMTLQKGESCATDAGPVAYDDIFAQDHVGLAGRAINTESVADYVGIPKETVRRKVTWLIARGWVARGDKATLCATKQSAADLAELSAATFTLLATVKASIDR